VEETLPPYVATYPIDHVYKHLEKFHGIATYVASNRLHRIKEENRLPADFKLYFDITGNVFRADDRTYLGSLTSGGKSRGEA
jgi:hypothetical protein